MATLVGGPFDGFPLRYHSGMGERIWFDGPPATAWYTVAAIYIRTEEPRPCYERVDDDTFKFVGWCKSETPGG
jgi:hypothetical protein